MRFMIAQIFAIITAGGVFYLLGRLIYLIFKALKKYIGSSEVRKEQQ